MPGNALNKGIGKFCGPEAATFFGFLSTRHFGLFGDVRRLRVAGFRSQEGDLQGPDLKTSGKPFV